MCNGVRHHHENCSQSVGLGYLTRHSAHERFAAGYHFQAVQRMLTDDDKSWQMETPRSADRDEDLGTPEQQGLSKSARQRALRRASNPAYSGSPGSSQNSAQGPKHMLAHSGSGEFQQTGRVQQVTDHSLDPGSSRMSPQKHGDLSDVACHGVVLTALDEATFQLQDSEPDIGLSSFPLQGGDSLAASTACSAHGSARHSLCLDDVADTTKEHRMGQLGHGDPSTECKGKSYLDGSVMVAANDALDHVSDSSTDVVGSAVIRTPPGSRTGLSGGPPNSSPPPDSENSYCTLRAGICIPAQACMTPSDSPPGPEKSLTTETIIHNTTHRNREAQFTSGPDPSSPCTPGSQQDPVFRPRPSDSAKDHHMNGDRAEDDACSESSVSVGSYFGTSPVAKGAQEPLMNATECSQFTFTSMPDAGHGSPQNHCFQQTPSSLPTDKRPASPHIVRALFTEHTPAPRRPLNRLYSGTQAHSVNHSLERLRRALCLIALVTSLATAVIMLGRGSMAVRQETAAVHLLRLGQNRMQHLCSGRLSNTIVCTGPTNGASFFDSGLARSVIRSARQQSQKLCVSNTCIALKHCVFRYAIVLNYRVRWMKDSVLQIGNLGLAWISRFGKASPVADSTASHGSLLLHAIVAESSLDDPEQPAPPAQKPAISAGLEDERPTVDDTHLSDSEDCTTSLEASRLRVVDDPDTTIHSGPADVVARIADDDTIESNNLQDDEHSDTFVNVAGPPVGGNLELLIRQVDALLSQPPIAVQAETQTAPDDWVQRIMHGWQFVQGCAECLKKIIFDQFLHMRVSSQDLARVLLESFHRNKAAVVAQAESMLFNSSWQRLHGIEHSLVFCSALALLMSMMSMLVVVVAPLFRHGQEAATIGVQRTKSDTSQPFFSANPAFMPRVMPSYQRAGTHGCAASFHTALSHGCGTQAPNRHDTSGVECDDTAASPWMP
eukprot:jgi/Ulvmu1/7532/UM037_0076.1